MTLENIKQEVKLKFETDPYYGIAVFDSRSYRPILKSSDKEKIFSEYGSIDSFFDQVFNDDIQEIAVRTKRKCGMTRGHQNWKDGKEAIILVKNPSAEVQLNFDMPKHEYTPFQEVSVLASPNNVEPKLSIPILQYTELTHDSKEKKKLEIEVAELKEKNARYRKKLKRYEKQETGEDYELRKMETKANSLGTLLEKATPMLTPLAGALAGFLEKQGATLASPPKENLSQIKGVLIEAIESTNDATAEMLQVCYNGLSSELFADKLYSLYLEFNLIQPNNNDGTEINNDTN